MKAVFENKSDGSNLDLKDDKDLNYYLKLTEGWKDEFPKFVIKEVLGYNVIDESVLGIGSKVRFADLFVSQIKEDEIVYCAPRCGLASVSLSYLAKKYNKKLTLFMPASKEASAHQLKCIELGATPVFRKIAAMTVLNSYAKKYANENNACFIPMGLKHELVTAAAVRVVYDFFKDKEKPKEMWSVISTGVLTRALQIALPDTDFVAVAVARNIQPGELGRARFISYHKAFTDRADWLVTEFDSAENYDAKGFEYMKDVAPKGSYFFNVAGNVFPDGLKASAIDSQRKWGEVR